MNLNLESVYSLPCPFVYIAGLYFCCCTSIAQQKCFTRSSFEVAQLSCFCCRLCLRWSLQSSFAQLRSKVLPCIRQTSCQLREPSVSLGTILFCRHEIITLKNYGYSYYAYIEQVLFVAGLLATSLTIKCKWLILLTCHLAHLSVCVLIDRSVGLSVCTENVLWQHG